MSNDPIRQMAQRNEQNLINIQMIRDYALLAINYANAAMLDNKEIAQILYSKDLEEPEKAEKILSLFERREFGRESDKNPQDDPDCEFEANLLRGLRKIRELAVGISSGNYAEKELISNESF